MIAADHRTVLGLLVAGAAQGIPGVLVSLTGITGASSRGVGTQMAVLADGRHAGSFSGGCIEAAVIAEAQAVLTAGCGRTVRFGSGSPYLDIRLPCGGGIDLVFTLHPDAAVLAQVLRELDARRPAALRVTENAVLPDEGARSGGFLRTYAPPLRLVALGHGEDLTALVRLAEAFGVVIEAFAPDTDRHAMESGGIAQLTSRTAFPGIAGDDWTAFVFLFHDHDWEEHLLPQALAQRGFYHGAVGSARTHRARVEGLRAAGVPEALLNALRGGIGLIPATRDPATLALSILSELVQDYQATAGGPGWTGGAPRTAVADVPSRP